MDMWVVAAAAGAGYLAKHWQKFLKEKEGLPDSDLGRRFDSRPLLEQLCDKTCASRRRLGSREVLSSKNLDGTFSECSVLDGNGEPEMASTSGFQFDDDISGSYGSSKDWNVLSLTSLPPELSGKRNYQENGDKNKTFKGRIEGGDKCAVRSKTFHGYSGKPLSSLDSCLTAQLYKEHVQMEEYLFSPFPSPSRKNVRPLLVTDGSRIIGRPGSDSYKAQFGNGESELYKEDDLCLDANDVVLGVPPLPEISHLELLKKPKQKKGKSGTRRLSKTRFSSKQLQSEGLPDEIFLFSLGISLGVMSTIGNNRREVDKLNKLLKQTENFVQDLQEELEMKDSLTVKELADEVYGSQQNNYESLPNQAQTSFSPSKELNVSSKYEVRRPEDHSSGEKSESMTQIEAELEAELERLEINMKASSLERRLCGLLEVDPDFEADFVQGELRADMVTGGAGGRVDSKRDTNESSTTQTQNLNFAVSPRELSLRLHEVIQSRLEERVFELEAELQNSQKRVNNMEARQMIQRNYSNIDMESSSEESPTIIEESNNADGPFFLHLSADALDAYNEACEEFVKNSMADEENQPLTADMSNQISNGLSHPSDHTRSQGQNGGGENGLLLHLSFEDINSKNLIYNNVGAWEERNSRSPESHEIGDTEDENDDDEFGRLLIQEIVEKARQGSPVVLNAKRMLYSMDEES